MSDTGSTNAPDETRHPIGTFPGRIAPAVILFFLAPLVAEFLLGNLPITMLSSLVVLAPMYGGGALLTYAWHAFPQPSVYLGNSTVDLAGNAVFAAGAVILIIAAARRLQRAGSVVSLTA